MMMIQTHSKMVHELLNEYGKVIWGEKPCLSLSHPYAIYGSQEGSLASWEAEHQRNRWFLQSEKIETMHKRGRWFIKGLHESHYEVDEHVYFVEAQFDQAEQVTGFRVGYIDNKQLKGITQVSSSRRELIGALVRVFNEVN
jgi:hypothetical protein